MFGELEGCGFEVVDDAFANCFVGHAKVERLWSGGRWLEGPAWFAAGRYLVFSDIPNERLMRWDETDGSVSAFRSPSRHCNGNTVDRQGRLVTCEHLSRSVTRTEHDGSVTTLAASFEGKRLNSPNDVVVKSDGGIWFTDPSYGILTDYEGARAEPELPCHVYRIDPDGTLAKVADDFVKPNGLAFSPDERHLYIADTGATHDPDGPLVCIHSVVTRPDARGRGVAVQLVREYLSALPLHTEVALIARAHHVPLYQGAGFVSLGPSAVEHGAGVWMEMRMETGGPADKVA